MKLKSRKFWIAVTLMGYGAIMGIRNANIGNDRIVTIVYTIGVIAVGIGYIFAEAMTDKTDAEVIVENNDETEAEG